MAGIRLTGAQVTMVEEALARYHRNHFVDPEDYDANSPDVPRKLAAEELVEDILRKVLPAEISPSLDVAPASEPIIDNRADRLEEQF